MENKKRDMQQHYLLQRILPGHHLFKTSLSMLLSLLMLMPLVSWAVDPGTYLQSGQPYLIMNQKVVTVPRQFGAVEQAYEAPNSRGVVIHIQDLHCHYEVQSNIANILKDLAQRLGINLIGIEGSGRLINTSKLGTFPLARAKKAVGHYLMKQGLISGAEYFSALSSQPLFLEGIENEELYLKNLQTARSFLNSESLGYCADLKEMLRSIKKRFYHQPLLGLEQMTQSYKDGRSSQADYAGQLWQMAKKQDLDLAPFSQIFRYLQQQKSSYVTGINPDRLQEEIGRLDQALTKALISTPQEAAINEVGLHLDVMEKLLSIAANRREVHDFINHQDHYRVAVLLKSLAQWAPQETDFMMPEAASLQSYLDDVARFYKEADQRSGNFVTNLSAMMEQHHQQAAVLITGGYHAQDVQTALKEAGFSYISVVPRLTHQDLINPYFQLIRDKKTPLETLLLKNQKLIAPPIRNFQLPRTSRITSTQPLSEETLQTMMAQLPEGLRGNIKSLEAMQQLLLWQQAMLERLHQAQSENQLSEDLKSLQHHYTMDERLLVGAQAQDFAVAPQQLQRLFTAVKSGQSMVLPMGNANLCLVAGPAWQLRPLTQLPYVFEAHGLAASVISSAQEGAVEQQLKQIRQKARRPWVVIGSAVDKWWREKPLSASVTKMASVFLPITFYHGSWSWHAVVDFWPSLVITAAIIIALAVMDWWGNRPTNRELTELLRSPAPGVTPYENWGQKLVTMVLLPIAESSVITLMVTGLSIAFLPKTSVLVEHFFHSTFQINDPWLAVPLLILFSRLLNNLFAKNFFGDLHRAKGEDVVKAINQAGTRTWWITWGLLVLSLMGVSVAPHASLAEVIWQAPELMLYHLTSTFGVVYFGVHTALHIGHNWSSPPAKRWIIGDQGLGKNITDRGPREALLFNLMSFFLKLNLKSLNRSQMDALLKQFKRKRTSSAKLKDLMKLVVNMPLQECQAMLIDGESLEAIFWKTYWAVVKEDFQKISLLSKMFPNQVSDDDLLKLLATMPESIWQDIEASKQLTDAWRSWAGKNISAYFNHLMLEMDAVVNPIYTSSDASNIQAMQDLNTLLQDAFHLTLKYPDLEGRLKRLLALGWMLVNYANNPADQPLAKRLMASINVTYNNANRDQTTTAEVDLLTPFFKKIGKLDERRYDYIAFQLHHNDLLLSEFEKTVDHEKPEIEKDLLINWQHVLWHIEHLDNKHMRQAWLERVIRQYQTYSRITFHLRQPPRPLQLHNTPLESIAASEMENSSIYLIDASAITHTLSALYEDLLKYRGIQRRFFELYGIIIESLNDIAVKITSVVKTENRMEAWLAWMNFLAILPPALDQDLPPRQNVGTIQGLDFVKENIELTWKDCSPQYRKENKGHYDTLKRLMNADQQQLMNHLSKTMNNMVGPVELKGSESAGREVELKVPAELRSEMKEIINEIIKRKLKQLTEDRLKKRKRVKIKPFELGKLFLLGLQIKNDHARFFYLDQLDRVFNLPEHYFWKTETLKELLEGYQEKHPYGDRLMQWALPVGLTALLGLSGLFYSPVSMAAGVDWILVSTAGLTWLGGVAILGAWLIRMGIDYVRKKRLGNNLAQGNAQNHDQEHYTFEPVFETIAGIGQEIDEGQVAQSQVQVPLAEYYEMALNLVPAPSTDVELDRLMKLGWHMLFYLEKPYNHDFVKIFTDRLIGTYQRFNIDRANLPTLHYLPLEQELNLLRGLYHETYMERLKAGLQLNQVINNFISEYPHLPSGAQQEGLQQLWPLMRIYLIDLHPSRQISVTMDRQSRAQYHFFKQRAQEWAIALPPIRINGKTIEELLEVDKYKDVEAAGDDIKIERIETSSNGLASHVNWENGPGFYKAYYDEIFKQEPGKVLTYVLADIKKAEHETLADQAEGELRGLITYMLKLLGQTVNHGRRLHFATELSGYLKHEGILTGQHDLNLIITLSRLKDEQLKTEIQEKLDSIALAQPMALLDSAYKALALIDDALRQRMLGEILIKIKVMISGTPITLASILEWYHDGGVDMENARAVSEKLPDYLAFLKPVIVEQSEKSPGNSQDKPFDEYEHDMKPALGLDVKGEKKPAIEQEGEKALDRAAPIGKNIRLKHHWTHNPNEAEREIRTNFRKRPAIALHHAMDELNTFVDAGSAESFAEIKLNALINLILELLGRTRDEQLRLTYAKKLRDMQQQKKDILDKDREEALNTLILLTESTDEELETMINAELETKKEYPSDYIEATFKIFAIRNQGKREAFLKQMVAKIGKLIRQNGMTSTLEYQKYSNVGIDLANKQLNLFGLPKHLLFLTYRSGQDGPEGPETNPKNVIRFPGNGHSAAILLASLGSGLLGLGHSNSLLAGPLDGPLSWGLEPNAWLLVATAALVVGWVLVRWWKERRTGRTVANGASLSRRLNTPYRRRGFKAIINVAGWIIGVFSPLLMTSIQSWKSLIQQRGKQRSREESLGPQHYFRSRIYKRILMNEMTGPWLGGAFLDRLLAAVILRVDGRTYWQTAAVLVSAGAAGPFDKLVLDPRQGLLAQLQARPGLSLAQRREELVRGLARIIQNHADELDGDFMFKAQELLVLSAPLTSQRLAIYQGRPLRLPNIMWEKGMKTVGGIILDGLDKHLGTDVIWDYRKVNTIMRRKPQQSALQGV